MTTRSGSAKGSQGRRTAASSASGRATLEEETRALVRRRIVEGAAAALVERGFQITAEDIAESAGVSRRTLFRHFPTWDAVVEAAVVDLLARYDALVPKTSVPGADLATWLEETAKAMHELNTQLMGKAFWDLNIERPGFTPALRAERRRRYAEHLAVQAWILAGESGRPPSWVVDAFALQLSGFATNCLEGYSAQDAGRVSARILMAVLEAAVAPDGKQAPPKGRQGKVQRR